MNLRLEHGLGQWTMDTNMTARDSMNHRVLSRRSKPENELFLSWTCCHYSEAGWPYAWAVCWGLGVYNCRLLHTTLLALLSKDMLPSPVQCSLPQHLSPPTAAFLVPHLSTTRSLPSFPPLHWVSIHPSGTGNCNVSYSIVFYLNSFIYKYSLH